MTRPGARLRRTEVTGCLGSDLRIEMEDGAVELGEGVLYVAPKGVRQNPVAEEECLLVLVERKSTQHTGDTVTGKTCSVEEQLQSFKAP